LNQGKEEGGVISVAGYLGGERGELRLAAGDLKARVCERVLEGRLSVEEGQALAERRARREGERYEAAVDYDPVLRAHCRLDQEG
jgi:hypothetical protein